MIYDHVIDFGHVTILWSQLYY